MNMQPEPGGAFVSRSRSLLRMLRSATAGTAGAIMDLLVLMALVEIGRLSPGVATLASAFVGAGINFFLNRTWAFKSRGPIWRQGGLYVIATAVWVGLSALVVHACVGAIRVPYLAARILADVAVFLGWGYPTSRWIFETGPTR